MPDYRQRLISPRYKQVYSGLPGPPGPAGGGGAWGAISGTLGDQTDLVAYIATQLAGLVDSAPGALDTLNELAAALGDDANFAATITAALAGKADKAASINAQSGTSYTLVLADAGKVVELTNAGAITLTIPPNSSVAFPIGTAIELHQGGAGTVTVAPDTGVTLVSRGSVFGLAGQEAVAVIRKVGADKWRLTGDIA